MNFEDKAVESLHAGEELYKAKKYNSCVNRLYYGIFQSILHKLDRSNQLKSVSEFAKKSPKGSHSFTIDWYMRNDLSKKVKLDKRIRANTNADSLRDLRYKADYSKEPMTDKLAKSALRHTKEFFDIVKNK